MLLRYFAALAWSTFWQASRVLAAALWGVPYRPGGVYDDAPREWGRTMLRSAGIDPVVHGLEHLTSGQPYVFASNHASFVDVWVLVSVLPGSLRFVAKRELVRIPLFGFAMEAGGQITIDRHNLKSAFSAYDEAAARIRDGMSAVVFAEGTRSHDGRLQPFKKGPFVLAIAAGVPVVPVWIGGTFAILPRGAIRIHPGPVTVRIGSPIVTAGLGYADRDALADRCHRAMEQLSRGVDAVPAPD